MKQRFLAALALPSSLEQEAAWGWRFWLVAITGHFLVNDLSHRVGMLEKGIGNLVPQLYFLLVFLIYCANKTNRKATRLWGRGAVTRLAVSLGICAALFAVMMAAEQVVGLFVKASPRLPSASVMEMVVVLVAAPLTEELFFRAALVPMLLRDFRRPWIVICYAAFIFMLAHFSFYGGALLLGLITSFLFLRLRSPYPGIVFHALCNTIALVSVALLPNLTSVCLNLHIFRMFLR